MAAHIVTSHGEPELMGRANRFTHSPRLDAVETLKAVQGIVNTYLANAATDGRGTIPTPEPSPVQMLSEHGKRELVGMSGSQDDAVWRYAGQLQERRVTDIMTNNIDEINATEFGMNDRVVPDDTPENFRIIRPLAANLEDLGDHCSRELSANLSCSTMESNGPVAHEGDVESMANGSIPGASSVRTPLIPAAPISDQDHLLDLANKITAAVSQITTDDAARIKVATAALELAAAARPPGDTIMGWFANMSVISAVRLFLHWGAFDIIPSDKAEAITYAELARRVHADEGLIVRVGSMLTSAHVLAHHPASSKHADPSLSHTPTSLLLASGQPMSAMFSLMYTNVTAVSTILPGYFDLYGRTEPLGPRHIPTSYLAGHPEEDYFSLLKKDEAALRNFGLAMRITSRRVPVTGMYDMSRVLQASSEGRETVWVDVGGGDGHTLKEFLIKYPGLRAEQCVVQDLEDVVAAAREQNDDELRGVRWVGMDFMREAPVKGALVYYLRHIMRDYSDPVSTTILRNISRAMAADSRVLISEQLNPDMSTMPGPLPLYAAFKDFSMLSIGGKERSLQQFAAVADAAGLRVSGVYRDEATPHAVVELALKDGGGGANGEEQINGQDKSDATLPRVSSDSSVHVALSFLDTDNELGGEGAEL